MGAPDFDIVVVADINADLILSGAFGQVGKLVSDARLVVGSSTAIFAGPAHGRLRRGGRFGRRHGRAGRQLHLGSNFLLDALRPDVPRPFAQAHASRLTVSLDTSFDPAERWNGGLYQALRQVDVFLPSATEARAISGKDSTEEAIGALAETVSLVAVKLGEQGATAKQGSGPVIGLPASPVEVVDTVGAGDCFDAGFLFGFLNGWDVRRALELTIACGRLSTGKGGGTEGQPDLAKALRFVEARMR